jgi:diguanylate cyclase (GGDEF)-like protein
MYWAPQPVDTSLVNIARGSGSHAHRARRPIVSLRLLTGVMMAGVLLSAIGLSLVAVLGIRESQQKQAVIDREVRQMSLLYSARASSAVLGAAGVTFVTLGGDQYLEDMDRAQANLRAAILELGRTAEADEGEGAQIQALIAREARLETDVDAFFELIAAGQRDAAFAIVAERDIEGQFRELSTDLEAAAADAEVLVAAASDEATSSRREWNAAFIGATAIWGLLILAACVVLFNRVMRPIERVAEAAHRYGSGDFEARVQPAGVREIDELATAFNAMAGSLEKLTGGLKHAASTDGLTGLPNHRSLQEELDRQIAQAGETGAPLAVMMMDIDGFKRFNDIYGHPSGDEVLRRVGNVLREATRAGDTIGRYGGDEFLAILPNTTRDAGVGQAGRILDAFAGQTVEATPISLSIGLAVSPEDARSKAGLLQSADASLYEAKRVRGNAVRVASQRIGEVVEYQETPMAILDALVRNIDSGQAYTSANSRQDAQLALMLGRAIDLPDGTLRALRIAALLHDVGQIGVPDAVLSKPEALTEQEREQVQDHVLLSKVIVQGLPNLQDVIDAVHSHHERWDGTGYPRGLKGEEIPLLGRVLAIADAYAAMVRERPHSGALSSDQAVQELRRNAGTQFDPALVEPFIGALLSSERAAA